MQISTSHEFAATPERVVAMMREEDFFHAAADRAGATSHSVTSADGVMEVRIDLRAPSRVASFVGHTLHLTQTIRWDDPLPDGSYLNHIDIAMAGLPMTMTAVGTIRAGGAGTVVSYDGDLTVRIPIVGGKIEHEAMPYLMSALDAQAEIGRNWLASA